LISGDKSLQVVNVLYCVFN